MEIVPFRSWSEMFAMYYPELEMDIHIENIKFRTGRDLAWNASGRLLLLSHNYEAARVSTWFMSNYIFFWSLIMVHVRTTQPFQNSPEGPSLHEYPFGLCIFWIVEFQIHRRDLPFSVTRLVPLNWYENTMKRRAHESLLSRYSSRKLGRIYNHYSGWWHLTMGSSLSGTVHAYSTKVKSDETAYIKTRVGYPFASSPNNLVDSGPKA